MASKLNRRAFLKPTAGLIALATLDLTNLNCASSNSSSRRVSRGANDRLNVRRHRSGHARAGAYQ